MGTTNPRPPALAAAHRGERPGRAQGVASAALAHLFDVDSTAHASPAFPTHADAAALLGVPERTLEGWRLTRSGPPWLKLGRHVRYDRDDSLAPSMPRSRWKRSISITSYVSDSRTVAACSGLPSRR